MVHKDISAGADAIIMDNRDDVATALRELTAGQSARYRLEDRQAETLLKDDIPFGHKFAIKPIRSGEPVRKYGEVIGQATSAIEAGCHVHVHNLEGIRGRGDRAGSDVDQVTAG
ncbi:UxaA family hydrolase [Paenibacillus sp. GCM10023252]|uniref:UxaA family hydrolase n=1 Tax=Paenibacillus sp. GCM10023252 TaxID=3252649 RepID=UPI003609CD0E